MGRPVAGVELKITEGGEVMFKSPGVFVEYYKNPEATAAAKTPDGWIHTGDAGYIDEHGHLKIIDRADDVGRLSNGTLFAPKYLENKLKFFPYIKEAVAFGHGRDHAAAFITIDMGAVGNWAERRGLAYSSYSELADKPEVYELIKGNRRGGQRATSRAIPCSRARRSSASSCCARSSTRTTASSRARARCAAASSARNTRRWWRPSTPGRRSASSRSQMKFEDGRTGTVRAVIRIADAETFACAGARELGEPAALKKAS